MTNPPFFHFTEHSSQFKLDPIQLSEVIPDKGRLELHEDQLGKYLGLHKEKGEYIAGYYIGLRWVSWDIEGIIQHGVIQSKPKHTNIPFEKLLVKCFSDEIVSQHMTD